MTRHRQPLVAACSLALLLAAQLLAGLLLAALSGCRPSETPAPPPTPLADDGALWTAPPPAPAVIVTTPPPPRATREGWVESPASDLLADPLAHARVLAVGARHALVATGAASLIVSEAGALRGVGMPAGWFWAGFGDDDALYVATRDGGLHRAEGRGYAPVAHVDGAATWDAAAGIIAVARGSEVLVSRDGGKRYLRRLPSAAVTIRRVRVRADGVVVAWGHGIAGPVTQLSVDGGAHWEASRFQPSEIDGVGGVVFNVGTRCRATLAADGRTWVQGHPAALGGWYAALRPQSEAPGAPALRPPVTPAGGAPLTGDESACAAVQQERPAAAPSDAPAKPACRGVTCVVSTTGRRVEGATRFGVLADASLMVVDRARGALHIGAAPPGCTAPRVLSMRGAAIVVCPEGDGAQLYAMARDGVSYPEKRVGWPPSALSRIEVGDDGTAVVPCDVDPCAGRALIRSPNPLGDASAWREVAVPGALAYRPLLLGAAVALSSPASVASGRRGAFGAFRTSDLLGGDSDGLTPKQIDERLHTMSLNIARTDGSTKALGKEIAFAGDLVGFDVGGDRFYATLDHDGVRRVHDVDDGLLVPVPTSPFAVSERSATHSAPESYNPYGIAVDATHVYWTDSIAGTVLRAPKGGGAVTTLASEQRTVAAVAVSATHVYFTIRGNGRAADGAVRRVPKGGGGIEEIAGQQLGPNAIVTDQHAVYWTSAGYAGALDGAVLRWLEQGGEPKALAVGLFEPRGLALDDNDVYVSSGDSILYVSKRGGPVASFIHGLKTPWALTTSDTHLSWSDPFAGAVGSAPLDDPSQASAITGLRTPVGVATCAGVVYASLIDAERVLLANKPIASIVSQPNALACDDSRVFVSSMSGRRVDAMGLAGEQPRAISNETARFRIRR